MSTDYGPAIWIPTDHHDGWGIFQPSWIIIHGTAGFQTAQQVGTYFQSNNPPSSTHYVVGRDGAVVQCVRETSAAWGNGPITGSAGVGGDGVHHDAWWDHVPAHNPNTCTFSIEHVKPHEDNSDTLTAAQQAASFALIKHLCEAHGIPKRKADAQGGITGHFSMDPVNRSRCPGPYPWDALFAYLNGGNTHMAWHEQPDHTGKDDKGNTCGTGVMALLASRPDLASADGLMRERYRGHDDAVLPLANGHSIVAHRRKPGTEDWDIQQDDARGLEMLSGIIADQDATIKDLSGKTPPAPPPTAKEQAAIALGKAIDAYEAAK